MAVLKVNGCVRLSCDECSREFRPRRKMVDLTVDASQRKELTWELRLRASRQGWTSTSVSVSLDTWRDLCPEHAR